MQTLDFIAESEAAQENRNAVIFGTFRRAQKYMYSTHLFDFITLVNMLVPQKKYVAENPRLCLNEILKKTMVIDPPVMYFIMNQNNRKCGKHVAQNHKVSNLNLYLWQTLQQTKRNGTGATPHLQACQLGIITHFFP